jgi:flagellar biogenesis protein FliO
VERALSLGARERLLLLGHGEMQRPVGVTAGDIHPLDRLPPAAVPATEGVGQARDVVL